MNILLIEDESYDIIKDSIINENPGDWNITVAKSYEEADDPSVPIVWDVIIADIYLPDNMRGDIFCLKYKRDHPDTSIILITGKAHAGVVSGLRYLKLYKKPFNMNDLIYELGKLEKEKSLCAKHGKDISALKEDTKEMKFQLTQVIKNQEGMQETLLEYRADTKVLLAKRTKAENWKLAIATSAATTVIIYVITLMLKGIT